MIKEESKGYTNIPNNIFDFDLTAQEQSLYIALLSFYNKDKGYAFPSYKQLKYRSKIKKDETLIKYINSLIEKKLLEKETIKGRGSKYYLPTPITEYLQNGSNSEKGVRPTPKKGEDPLRKRSTTNTNINTNTNTICSNDDKVVDIKSKKEQKKPEFEEIWSLYPNKKGRVDAEKLVAKLLKKHTKEELIRVVTRYTEECIKYKTEQRYIKNGDKFFESRYEDYLDSNFEEQELPKAIKRTCTDF